MAKDEYQEKQMKRLHTSVTMSALRWVDKNIKHLPESKDPETVLKVVKSVTDLLKTASLVVDEPEQETIKPSLNDAMARVATQIGDKDAADEGKEEPGSEHSRVDESRKAEETGDSD
jgi:hypothetical protein